LNRSVKVVYYNHLNADIAKLLPFSSSNCFQNPVNLSIDRALPDLIVKGFRLRGFACCRTALLKKSLRSCQVHLPDFFDVFQLV
jgi:hypothetical protein